MLTSLVILPLMFMVPTSNDCGSETLWGSDCSVTNTGTSVEIGAVYDEPDGSFEVGSGGSGDSGSGSRSGAPERSTSPLADENGECDMFCQRGVYAMAMLPRPTLSDVASFAPASSPVAAEPGGFGVAGMPVNFVATASAHSVTGELFSMPVTVRFEPVDFVFDHGDGTSRVSTQGGASWGHLGVPQFTATATSHAYSARGVYGASVTVRYSAAVDFGTGWRDVDGLLALPGPTSSITVVEARTGLVEATCIERPTAPGC